MCVCRKHTQETLNITSHPYCRRPHPTPVTKYTSKKVHESMGASLSTSSSSILPLFNGEREERDAGGREQDGTHSEAEGREP